MKSNLQNNYNKPYNLSNSNRVISGNVVDYENRPIVNATVMLFVNYIDIYCNEVSERLGYVTTDEYGRFAFTVDISKYNNSDFIVEVFKPLNVNYNL